LAARREPARQQTNQKGDTPIDPATGGRILNVKENIFDIVMPWKWEFDLSEIPPEKRMKEKGSQQNDLGSFGFLKTGQDGQPI